MTMRVYCGTYHKYNSGSLFGRWLDIEDYADKEEFHKACAELHKDEEDPEFMFQDWEDIPDSMIGESWISDEAFELAQLSEEDRALWEAYRDAVNEDGTLEEAKEAYFGTFKSEEDFAEDYVEECCDLRDVPDLVKYAIDYSRVARDLEDSFVYTETDAGTMVFRR